MSFTDEQKGCLLALIPLTLCVLLALFASDVTVKVERGCEESVIVSKVYHPMQRLYEGNVVDHTGPFYVVVQKDGRDTLFHTNAATWSSVKNGDKVNIIYSVGWLFGIGRDSRVEKKH